MEESHKELDEPIGHLKEAIENLQDDREKQLEVYQELMDILFNPDPSARQGVSGLLTPEILESLVSLLNNMTTSSKTKADISKTLYEAMLIKRDFQIGEIEDNKGSSSIVDRRQGQKLIDEE